MQDEPSDDLLQLLGQLRLASRDDVLAVGRRARRLARGLPLFDSVWVDALAQARVLTPYQAQQINSGRGKSLQLRDCVICRPIASPAYAQVFEACENSTGRNARLLTARFDAQDQPSVQKQLQTLISISRRLSNKTLAVVKDGGVDQIGTQTCLWCISHISRGVTAREWLIPNGRMPHGAVLQIARRMAAALAELERFELLHTDLSLVNLVLGSDGDVCLVMPGVRGLVRPEEGYGHADLAPDAYDYVSPERIVDGTAANTASELYACGTLWWHLLTGRPAIPGGDSLAKLRNIQRGRIPDVRQLAPETSECLADAIAQCTQYDVAQRGSSFAELARQLGAPSDDGTDQVSACVHRHLHPEVRIHAVRRRSASGWRPQRIAAAATAAAALLCAFWFLRSPGAAPKAYVPPPQTATEHAEPSATAENPLAKADPAVTERIEGLATQNEFVTLTADEAAEGRLPNLHAGMIIRGRPDARPKLVVPPQGLVIDQPHVRLENIDFVWQQPVSSGDRAAMVWLRSRWVEFHQCSFQSAELPFGSARPVAVAVIHGQRDHSHASAPGSAHVAMDNCVLRRVAAGVDLRRATSLTVESFGTLHLGPGPFVTMNVCPGIDQPVKLSLTQFTLRGATALAAFRYDKISPRPGTISVAAKNSVFSPQVDGALLYCEGRDDPQAMLDLVRWSGHGSLLSLESPLAVWQAVDGDASQVDDAKFAINGLTRGKFEFSGPQVHLPVSSRLKHWTAPLRGASPPGIGAADLHLPQVASE